MKEHFCVNVNRYDNKKSFCVTKPSSLNNPKNNSVMFILENYLDKQDVLENVKECLVFWPKGHQAPKSLSSKHLIIYADDPRNAYSSFFVENCITNLPPFEAMNYVNGSFLSLSCKIGERTTIMQGCFIGQGVIIGDDCYVGAGTRIVGDVEIGNRVVIRENTVIGADGLTTDRDKNGKAVTMPQFGRVVIEDDVQIGSNTVIARGAIDETRICQGSKIDNSCFISHNVRIGENTFIVGETIMFGSSSTGKNSMISGNSTIRNGVNVGERSLVGMGSVVTKNVPDGAIVKGNPAK